MRQTIALRAGHVSAIAASTMLIVLAIACGSTAAPQAPASSQLPETPQSSAGQQQPETPSATVAAASVATPAGTPDGGAAASPMPVVPDSGGRPGHPPVGPNVDGQAVATREIGVPVAETVVALLPTPTPTPTATALALPPQSGGAPSIAGCPFFPPDNPWNQDVSQLPVDPNSAAYIASIGKSGNGFLHADFGGGGAYGIPYVVVPPSQPLVPINFTAYGDESDPGPYPVPLNVPMEGGGAGDSHVIAVQQGTCRLYEMFNAHPAGGGWNADSGAVFDLRSNALRPDSWTSADAAGLPILAGLVRYDEVQAGAINHALRFTVGRVQRAWVHPATHYGTSTDPATPPYGTRLRLKPSFDVSAYHGQARVVLEALRRYGMIVADQGTSWFITGASDPRWDDDDLNQLKTVPGTAFEVVQLGPIIYP